MESSDAKQGPPAASSQITELDDKGQQIVILLNDLFDTKKVAKTDALHFSRICLILAKKRCLLESITSAEIVKSFFWRSLENWMDDTRFPPFSCGKMAIEFARIACACVSLTKKGMEIIYDNRFQTFLNALPIYCGQFTLREASNCFCILAMLEIRDERVLSPLIAVLRARLLLSNAVARDITNIMWAAAMLGMKQNNFIADLLIACKIHITSFDMKSLANNLWAFTTFVAKNRKLVSDLTVRFAKHLLPYNPMSPINQHVAQQMLLVLLSSNFSRGDKVMLESIISKIGMRALLDCAFCGYDFVSAFTANKSIIKDIFDALISASLLDNVIMGHWIVADLLPIAIYGTKMKDDGTVMKFAIELDLGTECAVADASDSNVDIPLEVHDNQPITPSSAFFRNCIMEVQGIHVVHISLDEWNRAKLEGKTTSYLQSILPQTPQSPEVGFDYMPANVKDSKPVDVPCSDWDDFIGEVDISSLPSLQTLSQEIAKLEHSSGQVSHDQLSYQSSHHAGLRLAGCGASTIFVGGLSNHVEDRDLLRAFEQFGNIVGLTIRRISNRGNSTRVASRSYPNQSYAFVEFELEKSASKAIRNMKGYYIDGRLISVSKSKAKMIENPVGSSRRRRRGGSSGASSSNAEGEASTSEEQGDVVNSLFAVYKCEESGRVIDIECMTRVFSAFGTILGIDMKDIVVTADGKQSGMTILRFEASEGGFEQAQVAMYTLNERMQDGINFLKVGLTKILSKKLTPADSEVLLSGAIKDDGATAGELNLQTLVDENGSANVMSPEMVQSEAFSDDTPPQAYGPVADMPDQIHHEAQNFPLEQYDQPGHDVIINYAFVPDYFPPQPSPEIYATPFLFQQQQPLSIFEPTPIPIFDPTLMPTLDPRPILADESTTISMFDPTPMPIPIQMSSLQTPMPAMPVPLYVPVDDNGAVLFEDAVNEPALAHMFPALPGGVADYVPQYIPFAPVPQYPIPQHMLPNLPMPGMEGPAGMPAMMGNVYPLPYDMQTMYETNGTVYYATDTNNQSTIAYDDQQASPIFDHQYAQQQQEYQFQASNNAPAADASIEVPPQPHSLTNGRRTSSDRPKRKRSSSKK